MANKNVLVHINSYTLSVKATGHELLSVACVRQCFCKRTEENISDDLKYFVLCLKLIHVDLQCIFIMINAAIGCYCYYNFTG